MLTEDELIELLRESRNSWINVQIQDVIRGLLPGDERTRPSSLLARWVADDDLTMAATLTRIAADDALARSPDAIAESLRTVGLVRPDVPAAEVAHHLVTPVVRRVRHDGVPWPRWWDILGLHFLLVELWTARRLAASPRDYVSRELRTIWQVTDEEIPVLLANAVNPLSLLPPDLFETSLTGEATQLLRGLIAVGKLGLGVEDRLPSYLPELGDRADLIEVVRRVRLRQDFEHAVRTYVRGIGPREEERIRADLASWDEQLGRFLPALTGYEMELACKPGPGTAYRDQCLAAGRNYWLYPLLEQDALPPQVEADKPARTAPLWMQDEIIGGGARAFRTNVGPYPVWLLTAETSLGRAAIEALGMPGQSYGLGHQIAGDVVEMRLRLPVPDDDPGPAREMPFFYPLSYVDSAWQLLHLAAVGYVRVVILMLNRDDALMTRGSILISLPDELRDELTEHALAALRSLVGDDMRALLWQRAVDEPEDISSATFYANESAKGEELLDETILEPPLGTQPHPWAAFQEASRALARARVDLIAAGADGRHVPELAAAVDQAIENRQRVREMARTGPSILDRQAWERSIAAALPDDQTAFIHFFIKDEMLQHVYVVRDHDLPAFSPVRSSPVTMKRLRAAVQDWASTHVAALNWNQTLQDLCAELAESVFQSLIEELHAKGITRLIISPTPPLDLLPLHAIPVSIDNVKRPLCEVVDEVTYTPTVRMMAALAARPGQASAAPVMVAHSGAGVPGFRQISGPALEAVNLRAIYPDARIIAESDAVPSTVLTAVTGSRVVHIASHAYAAADRWASGLLLQGEQLSDAVLSAAAVLADGDLSGVQLVVLNACRTGSHRSASRVVQTLRGLEAVFLARGARTVVSTFWEIEDLTALVFATLLHTSMAGGDSPGRAYRSAIAYLRGRSWRRQACLEGSTRRAETLLDQAKSTWREEMDAQVGSNPLAWSAFKITGLAGR